MFFFSRGVLAGDGEWEVGLDGKEGLNPSASNSREMGSGFMLLIIEMTHMKLIEPLESKDYTFK